MADNAGPSEVVASLISVGEIEAVVVPRYRDPRSRGRISRNSDPTPSVLAAVMSPCIARARSRLIARPNPVPSRVLVSVRPTCTKGSKIASSFSNGMPDPVSRTSSAMRPVHDLTGQLDRTAGLRELDGVGNEVDHDLLDFRAIRAKERVRAAPCVIESNSLRLCLGEHHLCHCIRRRHARRLTQCRRSADRLRCG